MSDNNDIPIRLDRVPASEARKRAAARRRAAKAPWSRARHTPRVQRGYGNVVCIRDWVLRAAEEGHSHADDPLAKARIERWMMRLSCRSPGDRFPS
ncbi:hypothetical protein [Sphingomonas sp. HMP6]|uniref:hypothetical protein n=1 Tax=Sphingomonas sp. HMP6 TaxID=1517551 RepID=UPI001596A61F|nr:hypothetical protein [Sphingomonas sp. HMP6]BCA58126.1 hypothetical protein HMP06_0895 [Sphingomonas sp. HMP6]